MRRAMKMFCGVLILRRVAATHVPTRQTKSEMHPSVADLDAIFTLVCLRGLNLNLFQMAAILA